MNAFRAAGVAALILAVPLTARAQACLGVPSSAGQLAVAGLAGFTEGYALFGGEVSMHAPSRITLAARFLVALETESPTAVAPDEETGNVTSYGGTIAYSVVNAGNFRICPMVGLEYRSWDLPTAVVPPPLLGTDDEFTELMIPVGLGAGMTLPTGPLNTTLYAVPQF
ncbi:MAG TPA: hypothetical protein VK939_10240, partial [Longimicrobiales bacterium]|nr:hypothetical protein [Longimicrobiales bacterium]